MCYFEKAFTEVVLNKILQINISPIAEKISRVGFPKIKVNSSGAKTALIMTLVTLPHNANRTI